MAAEASNKKFRERVAALPERDRQRRPPSFLDYYSDDDSDDDSTPTYNLNNVGSVLTTPYQLRRELELKGAFVRFFADDTGVNYDSWP